MVNQESHAEDRMNSKTVKEACSGMYVQWQVNSPGAQREFLTLLGFSGKQLWLRAIDAF